MGTENHKARSVAIPGIEADELIVDNFAGGGGASTGIELALGRPVDIAIDHDPEAIAMHAMNHPDTLHLCENVWQVDIAAVVAGWKVGLAWFSPDCKHFSKAKCGKPLEKQIRGLAWVALRWAGLVKPRVIMLENVEEFQTWGPLVGGKPCPKRKGQTFRRWVKQLQDLGYTVDWREMRACEFGAPTIRKRLFIVARRDVKVIPWPEATHGPEGGLFLQPYRTAADCIDWSLPCPSIFLTKEEARAIGANRPLAEATMRRIGRGVERYVIESAEPFIVSINHGDSGGAHRGEKSLVVPTLVQTGYGERDGQAPRVPGVEKPLGTVVGSGKHALVAAYITRCRDGQPVDEPMATVSAGGLHIAEVRAFLLSYYSTDQNAQLTEPIPNLGIVTVHGIGYQIVDIGMRMLSPRELFRAQGFPDEYVIERGRDPQTGAEVKLTKTAQVRLCGNSVSPPPAEALVRAQFGLTRAAVALHA